MLVPLDLRHVTERAQTLSDIELAMLLSLIARQHAIIESDAEDLDAVEQETCKVCNRMPLHSLDMADQPDCE